MAHKLFEEYKNLNDQILELNAKYAGSQFAQVIMEKENDNCKQDINLLKNQIEKLERSLKEKQDLMEKVIIKFKFSNYFLISYLKEKVIIFYVKKRKKIIFDFI